MPGASFLGLPPELRVLVYEYVALSDLISFADCFRLPSLLRAGPPLENEYADVFFADENIALDVYYPETDSWCVVSDKAGKRDVLERATVADLFDRSLASAKRSVQRLCRPHGSSTRRGILRIRVAGAPRWSSWAITEGAAVV